jgi:hypothetical protein
MSGALKQDLLVVVTAAGFEPAGIAVSRERVHAAESARAV